MKTTYNLIFMLCHIDFFVSGDDYKALIVNLKENPSLIYIPAGMSSLHEESSPQVPCNTWASACPAETEDEKKFSDIHSFYHTALFVKKIYNEGDSCSNILKDRCKHPYRLSISLYQETVEFGYELYFQYDESVKSRFDEKYAAVYDDYEPLKNFLELESLPTIKIYERVVSMASVGSSNDSRETMLTLKGKQMEFIWISLFKLWFSKKRLQKIEYQIRKDNIYPRVKCDDYSLGEELIYYADIDKMYSKENQKITFKGLDIFSLAEEHRCEESVKCFTKWLLLPSDQFQFGSDLSSNFKCSNVTTVPIWKSTVEKILEKLDAYLYAFSRVSQEPVWVDAGVKGKLSLPRWKPAFWMLGLNNHSNVTLVDDGTNFSISASNIIYKLVKFKSKKNRKDNKNSYWLGILIVIHNDPYYDGKKKICEDITDEWGWSAIKLESYKFNEDEKPSKFIYACKVTRQSVNMVGLTYGDDLINEESPIIGLLYGHQMIVEELSLKKFPVYDGAEMTFISIEETVNEELQMMNEKGGSFKVRDEMIERPPLYDEEFDVIRDDVSDDSYENFSPISDEDLQIQGDEPDSALEEAGNEEAETSGDAESKKDK